MSRCPVQVNFQRCIGCLQCVRECPKSVLTSNHMKSTVTYPEKCIACGNCVSVCPVGAISFHGIVPNKLDLESFGDITEVLKKENQLRNHSKVHTKQLRLLLDQAKYSYSDDNFYERRVKIIEDDDDKYKQIICTVGDESTQENDIRFLSTLTTLLNQHNIAYEWIDNYSLVDYHVTSALAIGINTD
ncbi:4Fe-4S ferredoxin-type domain-containing protein [Entamoeba marina]